MKRILSLVVSVSVLFSYVPPMQGQILPVEGAAPAAEDNMIYSPFDALTSGSTAWPEYLQQRVEILEDQMQQQLNSVDEKLIEAGAKLAKEQCPYHSLKCINDVAFKSLRQANWTPEDGEVCNKDKTACVPLLAFAQGGVHWALQELLSYQGQLIVESADSFTNLVVTYGVHSEEDRQAALDYFSALIEAADSDCGKTYTEYGSASRRADARNATAQKQNRCSQELSGLYGLAMLSKTQQENQAAVKKIYTLLKRKYDSAAAGSVIPSATTALATVGTEQAYQAIYDFLMDESLPSVLGNAVNISVKSGAQAALRASSNIRGGNSRYLNRINEQFQYLDEDEAARQGYSDTSIQHQNRQYPYGNMLEDVGRLLGEESARNTYAAQTAQKIIKTANNYVEFGSASGSDRTWIPGAVNAAGQIHYPVVLGILEGWRTSQGQKFALIPSEHLLRLFYEGDWWDINEGTQQRVHYKAWLFAKTRGLNWKVPGKDLEKQERYIYNERLLNMGNIADLALMPVFVPALVAAVPSAARSLSNAAQWLQANRKYIGFRFSNARSAAAVKEVPAVAAPVSKAPAASRVAASRAGSRSVQSPVSSAARTPARPALPAATPEPAPVSTTKIPISSSAPKVPFKEPALSSLSRNETDAALLRLREDIIAEGKNDDLLRFTNTSPLIAGGTPPPKGGFWRNLFGKNKKPADVATGSQRPASASVANTGSNPAGIEIVKKPASTSAGNSGVRSVAGGRTTPPSASSGAAARTPSSSAVNTGSNPAGIEIVRKPVSSNPPGIEIVKKPASTPAGNSGVRSVAGGRTSASSASSGSAARTPSSSAANTSSAAAVRSAAPAAPAGNSSREVMRVGDVLDGTKIVGGAADDAVNASRTATPSASSGAAARPASSSAANTSSAAAVRSAAPAAPAGNSSTEVMRVGDVLGGTKTGGAADAVHASRTTPPSAPQPLPAKSEASAAAAATTASKAPAAPAIASKATPSLTDVTKIDSFGGGVEHYTRFSPDRINVSFKNGTTQILTREELASILSKSPEGAEAVLRAEQADLVRGATSLTKNADGSVTLKYTKSGRTGSRTVSADDYARLRKNMQEPYLSALQELEVQTYSRVQSVANKAVFDRKYARLRELLVEYRKAQTPGARRGVREEAAQILKEIESNLSPTDARRIKLSFEIR